MPNFNQAIKSIGQNYTDLRGMTRVTTNTASEITQTPKPETGRRVVLSESDWAEILKTNKKRFEAILRANPNDESARWYLENTEHLLRKLYSQGI